MELTVYGLGQRILLALPRLEDVNVSDRVAVVDAVFQCRQTADRHERIVRCRQRQ